MLESQIAALDHPGRDVSNQFSPAPEPVTSLLCNLELCATTIPPTQDALVRTFLSQQ